MKLLDLVKNYWEKLNTKKQVSTAWDKIRAFFSNRKRNIILIILAGVFILNLILGAVSNHIISLMPEMLGADRWSKDHRMAQISIFFTEDRMVEEDGIKRLEYNLEKKLIDAGITTETYLEGNPDYEFAEVSDGSEPSVKDLYVSSYCAQGIVTIGFENRTAENINAIGVGGDFFLIHPLTLINGSYFNDDNLMKDGIVIDEELAWQLFGSNDVVGQQVSIGNVPHFVVGVIRKDRGRMRKAAGLNDTYVYMSYDSLAKYGDILSGKTESIDISEDGKQALSGGINCYEVIMPNPVDGLAAKIVKDSSETEDRYISVIDNTDRFSFFSLIKVIRDFGTRSMWGKPIFYPYWENTARGWEDVLAMILVVRILCVLLLVVSLVLWIIHLYRHKKWTVEGIIRYLLDKKYEFESRRKHYENEETSV